MKKNFSAPVISMFQLQANDTICTSSTEIQVDLNGSGVARIQGRESLDEYSNMWEE